LDKQKLEFELKGNISDFTRNITAARGDLKKLSDAVEKSLSSLPGGNKVSAEIKNAGVEAEKLIATLNKYKAAGKVNTSQLTEKQNIGIRGQELSYKASLGTAKPSTIDAQTARAAVEAQRAQESAVRKQMTVERAQASERNKNFRDEQNRQNKLITLRYALYDVSSLARSAATATLQFAGAVLQAQVAQEKAFSQIEKTQVGTETTTQQLEKLKNELISLSTEIPVSFDELSKIGMLGAQLGVLAPDLAQFTETVAKFSAVTGVSVDEAAMGFGKVASLLGLAGDQYQSLGSAIAKVGVSSAATESQIINTAGQIGAVAKAAGFSASQIIGLSSALASLKVAPEEARGVLIPTFHAMDAAARSFSAGIGTGSEQLRVFAEVAGMSQAEFAAQWSDKSPTGAGKVWENFVRGLGTTDIGAALNRLGLDGTRTSKGLTALGNNAEFVFEQIKTATAAGMTGTFLDEASGKIIEDLASKLTMLQNSFQNLMASMGSNDAFVGVIGGVLDAITNVNNALTTMFNKSDFMSAIAGITVGLIAAIGALASIATVALAGAGGMLALRTAFINFSIVNGGTTTGIMGFLRALIGVSPATVAASAAMRGLTVAEAGVGVAAVTASAGVNVLKTAIRGLLISTGIGALVTIIGLVVEGFVNAQDASSETVTPLDAVKKKSIETAREFAMLRDELAGMVDESQRTINASSSIEEALFKLGKGLQKGKNDFSVYSESGRTNIANLGGVIAAVTQAANGDQQVLANNLNALAKSMIAAGINSVVAMQMIANAIAATGATAADATFDIQSVIAGLNDTSSSAGRAKTALEKLDEILQKVFRKYDVRSGIQDALDSLGQSLATNGKSVGYTSKGMRENLQSIKDTITAFKEGSGGDLKVFTGNLAALRAALTRAGVTGGIAFNLIDEAIKATKTKGKTSAKEIAAVYNSISNGIATEQAKNIRKIGDYVSDLSKVLKDAFENRYGVQTSRDSITSAFNSIKESADSAAKAVKDATDSIAALKADKGVLQYQLGVAIKYGDTLRANSIQAKLDKINTDIAEQEKKQAEATDAASMSLEGKSQSAIDNRARILGLVSAGNEYLLSLARTGASSQTLKDEAAELADEFMDQGTQLGFAKDELTKYVGYFKSDFTTVINGVPKDITISVFTDPALQAVKDFVGYTNAELAKIVVPDIKINTGIVNNAGSGNPSGPTTPKAPAAVVSKEPSAAATAQAKANASRTPSQSLIMSTVKKVNELESLLKEDNGWTAFFNPRRYNFVHQEVQKLRVDIAAFKSTYGPQWLDHVTGPTYMNAYATGGYVSGPGSATSDSIPARLSNGEYVIQANAVQHYGTDFMNALNRMQVQQGNSGFGPTMASQQSSVVYLSPEDRQLLRAATSRPITLYSDDKKIAQSTNSGNAVLAQRGSN
jgi:TP901 family phage tail tape measure protein